MRWLPFFIVLAACGTSTTTGGDASTDGSSGGDAAQDAQQDAQGADASANDSSADDATSGDGGLGAGADCDPKNDQCATGLLCCPEPDHLDGGVAYWCEKPVVNKGCPLLP